MKRDTLIAYGIDYDAGVRRFMGDSALYEEMLSVFLDDDTLDAAEAAFARGDYKAVFDAAHAMKGAAGNLDMTALYAGARRLTEYLRGNAAPVAAEVGAMLDGMRTEQQRVAAGIKAAG